MTAVVIGGGANGLAIASALARGGERVLLLEANAHVGGLAASEEFAEGYRSAGVLHDATRIRPNVVRELELVRHGLELRDVAPSMRALCSQLKLGEALEGASPVDVAAFGRMQAWMGRVRPVLTTFCDEPPVNVVALEDAPKWTLFKRALGVRRLGRDDMLALMRAAPMSIADWLDEQFEDDVLKATLALPGVLSTFTGPRSPGGMTQLLLQAALKGKGCKASHLFVRALEASARAAGVEVRTNATVTKIEVEQGRVRGVIVDGESIPTDRVAASCDPKTTFLELVEPMHLSSRFETHLRNWRCRGTTAHLLLALRGETEFGERACVAGSLDEVERAFDGVKYGELPKRPVLDIAVPSIADPSLCPSGHSVVSVLVSFVPHEESSQPARDTLLRAVLERLRPHIAELDEQLVSSRLSLPSDLARRHRLTGGHLHHGEHALDQTLVRPVPECATHTTPIGGLFLCGAGTHPGGGVHGGCGLLAARAMA